MIDWENITLKELAGYVSEGAQKARHRDNSCRWRLRYNLL